MSKFGINDCFQTHRCTVKPIHRYYEGIFLPPVDSKKIYASGKKTNVTNSVHSAIKNCCTFIQYIVKSEKMMHLNGKLRSIPLSNIRERLFTRGK